MSSPGRTLPSDCLVKERRGHMLWRLIRVSCFPDRSNQISWSAMVVRQVRKTAVRRNREIRVRPHVNPLLEGKCVPSERQAIDIERVRHQRPVSKVEQMTGRRVQCAGVNTRQELPLPRVEASYEEIQSCGSPPWRAM